MHIGGRRLGIILAAPFKREHYIAALGMLSVYDSPMEVFYRYLLEKGNYPEEFHVNTPLGKINITAYSHHDLLTINEIFCRDDYKAGEDDAIVVDFGSNIGISAAYFLTRNTDAYVYMLEPLPRNVERARHNLRAFEGRYEIAQVAVGPEAGDLRFGVEETGRYGGIGVETGDYITVHCMDSNEILSEILERHGHIDILKIDVEGMEETILERIPRDIRQNIRRIYAECTIERNVLQDTHTFHQRGSIARFIR